MKAQIKALLNNAKRSLAHWKANPEAPSQKEWVKHFEELIKRYTKRLNSI